MRLTIQIKPNQLRYIDFGYDTKMFSQMYFITSGIEYLKEDGVIEYATMDFTFIKHYKHWK